MDFKIAKTYAGSEKVLKNMNKVTGGISGDIEEGMENAVGKMEAPGYLTAVEKEGKFVSKQIVDKMNAGTKSIAKRLEKKMEGGPIAFRKKKGKKSKRK